MFRHHLRTDTASSQRLSASYGSRSDAAFAEDGFAAVWASAIALVDGIAAFFTKGFF